MKLSRKWLLVVALLLSVTMATASTLAFLTDRDTVENTFTMGNVDIEVEEEYEQDSTLNPGVEVEKKAGIKNVHKTSDAWVWMTVSVPAELENHIELEWLEGYNVEKIDTPVHEGYVSYVVKHPYPLLPGTSTPNFLQGVTLSEKVDFQDGKYVMVDNGEVTEIDLDDLKVIVDGFAIQTEGFATVDEAYEAYTDQWGGLTGGESGANGGEVEVTLPTTSWLDYADTTWYQADVTSYTIDTAAELAGLSKLVYNGNTFANKTIELGADIDLGDHMWNPIGRMINTNSTGEESTFKGTFDGKNHTVSNLYIDTVDGIEGNDTNKGAGLFGAVSNTISNVTVDTAVIKTAHWAGTIAGSVEVGGIVNCHAKNITIECLPELIGNEYDNGDKAGGIVGYISAGADVENCTVTNATITGYRDIGGVVGYAHSAVKNCTISNVTLSLDNTYNYKNYTTNDAYDFGDIVGEIGDGSVANCSGTAVINYGN